MGGFDFKSRVCTSRKQSKRLLALGLNPETADMIYERNVQYPYDFDLPRSLPEHEGFITGVECDDIPAWSLDRLRELLPKKIQYDGPLCYREYQMVITDDSVYYVSFEHNDWLLGYGQSLWESILIAIEWLINEELFNNEYLCAK